MPQFKVENLYRTTITSSSGIAASGDVNFTVTTPPINPNGYIVISPDSTTLREIMYYHNVSGNTIYVRAENRISPKAHSKNEVVQINDVAEIFNTYSDMISTCFYVEKTGGLTVKVWGGTVYYNALPQTVVDTNLTLTNDTTNYIKYDFATNVISVDTVNSGNIKVSIIVVSGGITSIDYKVAKESYQSLVPGGGDLIGSAVQTISGLKTFLDGKIGFRNIANTFTSLFSNTNTAIRTYTFPDKSGTLATDDIADFYKYSIVTSVASGNLTVALKNYEGNDPTPSKPVKVQIGGVVRTITSALGDYFPAGTNWRNAGSSELATKEIDYFCYIGIDNLNNIRFGCSRIPNGINQDDFSVSGTYSNEKYLMDYGTSFTVVNIGRFNATLSAGGAYTWSIPATSVIVNRPIYENQKQKNQLIVGEGINQSASYTTSVTMDFSSFTEYDITAQAGALLFNNPSGTPVNGQKRMVRIKDNGTARALTYGSQFASGSATLLTTTAISKKSWMGFEWDSTDSKYYCIAAGTQP